MLVILLMITADSGLPPEKAVAPEREANVVVDYVDEIEFNHTPGLSQVIFWEETLIAVGDIPRRVRRVVAWKMDNEMDAHTVQRGEWKVLRFYGDSYVRLVKSKKVTVSYTEHDPERADFHAWSWAPRRGLTPWPTDN